MIIWIHLWNLRYINISPSKNRRLTSSHSNRLSFEADPVSTEIQIVSWVRSYDNCEAPKSFWLIPYEPKDCVLGWSRPLNREVVRFGCQNKKTIYQTSNGGKTMPFAPSLSHPSVITIFIGGIYKQFPGKWVVNMALFYQSTIVVMVPWWMSNRQDGWSGILLYTTAPSTWEEITFSWGAWDVGGARNGGFLKWGYPNSWMVYIGKPPKKCMIWGYSGYFRKPPNGFEVTSICPDIQTRPLTEEAGPKSGVCGFKWSTHEFESSESQDRKEEPQPFALVHLIEYSARSPKLHICITLRPTWHRQDAGAGPFHWSCHPPGYPISHISDGIFPNSDTSL